MSTVNPLQSSNTQPTASAPANILLQKKGLLAGKGRGGMGVVSPTDNVLSPCSAKLSGAKQRHFIKGGKPMGITSQLSQLAASGSAGSIASNNENKKVDF